MQLRRIYLGLSLTITVWWSFHPVASAQTVVRQASKQQASSIQKLSPPVPKVREGQTQKNRTTKARTATVLSIGDQQAQESTTSIRIFPGRSNIIDFRNGEIITFIRLANQERIVYYSNAPVESRQARLIALNLTDPLPFKGQTRPPGFGRYSSSATNLVVSTINSSGEYKSYIFDLIPATGNPGPGDRNGVAIVPQGSPGTTPSPSAANPTIQTNLGSATLSDIKRGLRVSLEKKFSAANDPIIFQVEECLALARNGVPLLEAAKQMRVPVSVITNLGEIGIADYIKSGTRPHLSTSTEQKESQAINTNQKTNQ